MCERGAIAESTLGPEVARVLRSRLADLLAAGNVMELPVAQPRYIGRDHRKLTLPLCDGWSLLVAPNHNRVPVFPGGRVNWGKVSRIRIDAIKESHG
jgi:hypothetical protein